MKKSISAFLFFFWSLPAALTVMAQTGTGSITYGYTPPQPLPIAPGQVATLYIRALKASPARATALPLPTTLSGVSVMAEEPSRGFKVAVPLFSIDAAGCGNGLRYICDLTAVTVQMPTDIAVCQPSGGSNTCPGPAPHPLLTVMEGGNQVAQIEFTLVDTSVHILFACDTLVGSRGSGCPPLVTHGDGTLVTGLNPARLGEEVVLYAVGLGATTPTVATGSAAGIPAPNAKADFALKLDFRPDARPSSDGGGDPPFAPVFVGLVPGFVGLYQVNFTLPSATPSGTRSCAGVERATNVTVNLGSSSSFDGVQICMQTGS